MNDDNVIQGFGKKIEDLPENILQARREATLYCAHASILLDEHDRTVQCCKCGATLDAFDFLLGNGLHIQRAWEIYRQMEQKLEALNESVSKLAREEKRLKALVKRLQDKTGAKLDVRRPL